MFQPESKTLGQSKCTACGADLKFEPGTTHLTCTYCGAPNEIVGQDEQTQIEVYDFEEALKDLANKVETQEQHAVKCNSCGATSTLPPNITSCNCPFCDTALQVDSSASTKFIKPHFVLPFHIQKNQAHEKFAQWITSLWFAPNDLKRLKGYEDKLHGMYLPNWAYDTDTYTQYLGDRGIAVYQTQTVKQIENGKQVERTQQVRSIRWTPVSGNVSNEFEDLLVVASNSVPFAHMDQLGPWRLNELKAYDERFLTGYQSEVYSINLKDGFEKAKGMMESQIVNSIYQSIGGDEQRIQQKHTEYQNIKFKHVLLPVYISAYQYNGKVYRFLVNGQTGKIKGDRPYSFWKIFGAIMAALALIGIVYLFAG